MNAETTTLKGIEQGRAEFAYEKVAEAKKELGEENAPYYKQYAKKIPAMIKTNGLGATIAFIRAKAFGKKSEKAKAYMLLENHIAAWLLKDDKNLIEIPQYSFLAAEIVKLESPQYRALTIEVLAFMNWLQRFADGMIEGEATDGD